MRPKKPVGKNQTEVAAKAGPAIDRGKVSAATHRRRRWWWVPVGSAGCVLATALVVVSIATPAFGASPKAHAAIPVSVVNAEPFSMHDLAPGGYTQYGVSHPTTAPWVVWQPTGNSVLLDGDLVTPSSEPLPDVGTVTLTTPGTTLCANEPIGTQTRVNGISNTYCSVPISAIDPTDPPLVPGFVTVPITVSYSGGTDASGDTFAPASTTVDILVFHEQPLGEYTYETSTIVSPYGNGPGSIGFSPISYADGGEVFGAMTSVSATWVEPNFPGGSWAAIWPGISGSGQDESLLQAGTGTNPSETQSAPWIEDAPAPGSVFPYSGPPVVAGSTITVSITQVGSNWQFDFTNVTPTGQSGSSSVTKNWTPGTAPISVEFDTEYNPHVAPEPNCMAANWLDATMTTSTGVTVNAMPFIRATQYEEAQGAPGYLTCTPTTPNPAPTPTPTTPPAPTCNPASSPVGPVVSSATDVATGGYWMVTPFGEVISCHAPFMGSPAKLTAPIVAIVATPHGRGYWLVGSDGGVFAYGTAHFYGSLPGLPASDQPHVPVVALVATKDGGGYYEVTSAGDVYSFGDAAFHGSAGNISLAKPIVGASLDPATGGYWLVAADGGVFSYNAPFIGSLPGLPASERPGVPVVGMAATANGQGYYEVTTAGDLYSFGDAPFHGSAGNISLAKPMVAMAMDAGGGYWLVASDGGVFAFGGAPFWGSAA